ncbi:Acetophenone carboxylase gamma subunit [compost metagenome]
MRGLLDSPTLPDLPEVGPDASEARIGVRNMYADEKTGMSEGTIYDFTRLKPGNTLQGPAVIHTPITTIVVQTGQSARMDRLQNIIVTFAQ